ncbi:hypothetical protein MED121_23514 [Marinomonas sp. MED121]|uniref:hypothetical protein n=1 Tax=Marinomonas sp. MED121 TaxID=314277 RepID=UPI00006904FB|nr:hypothetical protein [Marinomonas sp. MED121]EAQ64770.1 hypothetical protein MED121_23514 [Marinomonas sp. MED121]
MTRQIVKLMFEHPQFADEIRLLNLHNTDFQNMAIEYLNVSNKVQNLDAAQQEFELEQYQKRQNELNLSIQSMLSKHALAAKV